MTSAVTLDAVSKRFGTDESYVQALDSISVTVTAGRFIAVMGPSGSGKSTLLRCAAGLEPVDNGHVFLKDQKIDSWRESRLTRFRRKYIGILFQDYSLLRYLNTVENVALPIWFSRGRSHQELATTALATVGLADRATSYPAQLSGGQQQRVALARTLVMEPEVVFADEPTGALDTESARTVLQMLRNATDDLRRTIVMVTHDPNAAAWADEVIFLVDGRIVGNMLDPTAASVAQQMTNLDELVAEGLKL